MITGADEEDNVPQHVLKAFEDKLRPFMGRELTSGTLVQLMSLVKDEIVRIRQKGFKKFPDLTLFALEHRGELALVRRDMEKEGIKRVLQAMTRKHPTVTREELALATKRAWPHYHPDDVRQEHHRITKILRPDQNGKISTRLILPGNDTKN